MVKLFLSETKKLRNFVALYSTYMQSLGL